MILVTTTPSVDGYTITNYQGIVFGEVVSGVNMFKDLGAGLRNMFGGRSQGYEEELMRARNEAIAEMQQRAEAMGAVSLGMRTAEDALAAVMCGEV